MARGIKIKLPVAGSNNPIIESGAEEQKITIENISYRLDGDGNALSEDGTIFKTKQDLESSSGGDINKIVSVEDKNYKLDDDGNALNEDGTIFKTKDELEKLIIKGDSDNIELVIIDDKEYKLDENGNALNSDNSVFMTKEQLLELEKVGDNNEETNLNIEEIEKLSGIELYDKTGNKIVYENTIEGIAKREADIKEFYLNQGSNSSINQFYEQNPEIYRMVAYKQKHGTLEGYKEEIDYSKVKLDKENENQLSDIILEAELAKGNSIDRAKKILGYIKADGRLFEEAEESQQYLTNAQNFRRQEEQKLIDRQTQIEIEQSEKYYGFRFNEKGEEEPLDIEGSIYDNIIVKGKIDDLIIPTDGIKVKTGDGKIKHYSRKDILRYVSAVADNGYSQAQIDESKRLSNITKLLKQYIYNLTGGDISSLVTTAKRREQAANIKSRFKTKQTKNIDNVSTDKRIRLPVN